jgi:hypothetical protein
MGNDFFKKFFVICHGAKLNEKNNVQSKTYKGSKTFGSG